MQLFLTITCFFILWDIDKTTYCSLVVLCCCVQAQAVAPTSATAPGGAGGASAPHPYQAEMEDVDTWIARNVAEERAAMQWQCSGSNSVWAGAVQWQRGGGNSAPAPAPAWQDEEMQEDEQVCICFVRFTHHRKHKSYLHTTSIHTTQFSSANFYFPFA